MRTHRSHNKQYLKSKHQLIVRFIKRKSIISKDLPNKMQKIKIRKIKSVYSYIIDSDALFATEIVIYRTLAESKDKFASKPRAISLLTF